MSRRPALPVAAVAILVCAIYLPTLGLQGPEMDEGTLVAYPEFVRDGLVPARDFATFYGPAQPWLTAGVFEVFGASLEAARVLGLLLRLALVLAIVVVGLRFGVGTALAAGMSCAVVLLPLGLAPYAIIGAVAFAAVALAGMCEGVVRERAGGSGVGLAVGAGVAGALAVTFRWDIGLALGLGMLPSLILSSWRLRRAFAASLAVGAVPLLIWAAVLGVDGIEKVVSELVDSRAGRRLPLSELSPSSAVALAGGLAGVVAGAAAVFVGWRRGATDTVAGPASLALLALGLLPSALQRVDAAHVLPFAAVGLGAAALSVVALAKLLEWNPARAVLASGFAILLSVAASQSFVRNELVGATNAEVELNGRSFPIRSLEAAASLNSVLAELESRSDEGQTLFVGPRDLSRTNYTDTFVYFMVPELEPASRYTEVNAGVTDDESSSLAGDITGADFLLLGERWDDWDEPNASAEAGSTEPNDIVDESFRLVFEAGTYELYARD